MKRIPFSRSLSRLALTVLSLTVIWLLLGLPVLAKVKLTYMSWSTAPGPRQVEEEIVRRFNETHPAIEVEFLPQTGSQALLEKILVMVGSGKPPDIAVLRGVTVGKSLPSLAVDLTPYMKADHFTLDSFVKEMHPLITRGNRIHGVPWGFGTTVLYYNRTLFDEAGLSYPRFGWTTDEFTLTARKLTRDRNGTGTPDQYGALVHWGHLYLWGQLFGGSLLSADRQHLSITQPEFVSAVQWVQDLHQKEKVIGGRPAEGTTGMWAEWDAFISEYVTAKYHERFDWGTSYFPRGGKAPTSTYGQGHVLAVMKGTKYPKEAWQFVKFYSSPEIQRFIGRNAQQPGTYVGLQATAREGILPPGYKRDDIYGPVTKLPVVRTIPWEVPGVSEAYGDLTTAFQNLLLESESARSAMERLAPVLNKYLADD